MYHQADILVKEPEDKRRKLLKHVDRVRLTGISRYPSSSLASDPSFDFALEYSKGWDLFNSPEDENIHSQSSASSDHVSDHIDNLWRQIREAKERRMACVPHKIDSFVQVTSRQHSPEGKAREFSDATEPSPLATGVYAGVDGERLLDRI